MNPGI